MEAYRSGHNEPDSKSGVPAKVPWVRIPPLPPLTSLSYAEALGRLFPCPSHTSGLNLRRHIKVSINVRRCAECGMTQPYLNLLHWHAISQ